MKSLRLKMLLSKFISKKRFESLPDFATALANFLWHTPLSRRKVILTNLKLCFPEWSENKIRGVAFSSVRENILTALEILHWDGSLNTMSVRAKKDLLARIYINSHVKDDVLDNSPLVILTGHYSNFAVIIQYFALKGRPAGVFLKKVKNSFIQRMVDSIFENKGVVPLYINETRSIYKARSILKENGVVMTLLDQHFGKKGRIKVEFFNRPAFAAGGVLRLAQRSGALIVPAFVNRADGRFTIAMKSPIWRKGDKKSIEELAQEFTSIMEDVIKSCPEPWAWMHKRWKV